MSASKLPAPNYGDLLTVCTATSGRHFVIRTSAIAVPQDHPEFDDNPPGWWVYGDRLNARRRSARVQSPRLYFAPDVYR